MRGDAERLRDILEAIARIEQHMPRDRAAFERQELVQVWSVYHLQIIGEAARAISEETRQEHPEIPWTRMVAMRNILVHRYFGIDVGEVWNTVTRSLPPLRQQIEAILQEL